ncbi:induced myeloid leukemia cell differentiation protein Mcl-1a [Astyanax mexicanus]|uniref:induced myeloid leukemia cell differentiation protein Mcl-1a n=1 Tax=Astyanax mexicanus TaxID=7994 RepID=UPI0020CB20E1|nr:induced myeloid leukemia cell differentiation protein Mcl-1a [Astyanax mexicanus]
MNPTAISLLCDGTSPVLYRTEKEAKLPRTERPERGLEGLQSAKGASMGGGSLPDSPRADVDIIQDFSCRCPGALEGETLRLMVEFYRGYLGQKPREQSPALRTMSRVVAGVVLKHGIAYNGMVQKLNLEEQDDSMDIISSVAKALFSDGTTNWGRIVSLVAFGAVVCDQLKKKSRDHCVENVAQHISTYLNTHQHQWLINNNAWDGFVEFFREDDSESRVRNALMAFAGFAGLGAGLALLMR